METTTFSFPQIPGFSLHIVFNRPMLMVVFVIFFLIYAVLSSVIFYHWSAYGMRSAGIMFARSLFIFVSIVLFVMAGFSIFYF